MNQIFLFTFIIGLIIGASSIQFLPYDKAISVVFGYCLMFFNVVLITVIWKLVYRKKKVALFGTVVVIKSLILLGLVYLSLKNPLVDPKWFFVGLSGYFLAIVLFSLTKAMTSKE